jgi:hypothetical protein
MFLNKLKIKFKTIKLILRNKDLRKSLLIDIIFYIYSFFGFIAAVNLIIYFNFGLIEVCLSWAIIFIPILFLKLSKETNKNVFKKDFYDR